MNNIFNLIKLYLFNFIYIKNIKNFLFYLGIGDWGLGIGDWGVGPKPQNPKPQTQTPKPQIIN